MNSSNNINASAPAGIVDGLSSNGQGPRRGKKGEVPHEWYQDVKEEKGEKEELDGYMKMLEKKFHEPTRTRRRMRKFRRS